MKKIALLLALILCFSFVLTACKKNQPVENSGKVEIEEVKNVELINEEEIKFLEEFQDIIKVTYSPREINPNVNDYKVEDDLSNVVNIAQFGEFTPEQKKALVENGFFIAPPRELDPELSFNDLRQQLFFIYEDNEYKNIPSFITTDSILHVYHLFYDNFLKNLEESSLFPKLVSLTQKMLEDSIKQYNDISDAAVKELALRNCAFFGTTVLTLGESLPENMPQEAADLAKEESEKIENQNGEASNILKINMDYTQFTPRGHYTKSDILKKYFKTVMYFGQGAFWEKDDNGYRDDLTAMALLITDNIFKNKDSYKLWSDIYEPINFLVEGADDLGPKDFAKLLYGVYTKDADLNNLLDKEMLERVYGNMENFPKPKIADFKGYSFRFMPQRSVLDNVFMQNLLDIAGPGKPSRRPVYSGLDLMATFGSKTAKKMQLENPKNKEWPEYENKLKETTALVGLISDEEWQKNIYRGWMWTLKELCQNFENGYPNFMQSEAWNKKDLNSALGSWAELKHDTVLYGKQTMAEMGGGGYDTFPKSYVEPNIKVYEKLSWLIEFTSKNLESRNMLTDRVKYTLGEFKETIDKLVDISAKELNNELLNKDDNIFLYYLGGAMESISLQFINDHSAYWDLLDDSDKDMAIVTDLMKVPENTWGIPAGDFLSVAVGPAYEIYVIYPVGDELHIGRGGVFSYREFISNERLTNEKWRDILKENSTHGVPDWMSDITENEKSEIPTPEYEY